MVFASHTKGLANEVSCRNHGKICTKGLANEVSCRNHGKICTKGLANEVSCRNHGKICTKVSTAKRLKQERWDLQKRIENFQLFPQGGGAEMGGCGVGQAVEVVAGNCAEDLVEGVVKGICHGARVFFHTAD